MDQTQVLWLKVAAIFAYTISVFFLPLLNLVQQSIAKSGITSLVLFVPVISILLFYKDRDMLKATVVLPGAVSKKMHYAVEAAGALMVISAIILVWHGSFTSVALTYQLLALPLFVAGLILSFFGVETLKRAVFPLALLLLIAPLPSVLLQNFSFVVSSLMIEFSRLVAGIFGVSTTVQADGPGQIINVQTASGLPLHINIAYNFVYCLEFVFLFALAGALLIKGSTGKRVLLALATVPLVFLANAIRVAVLLTVCQYYNENIGFQIYHLFGGWVLGSSMLLLVLLLAQKYVKNGALASSHNGFTYRQKTKEALVGIKKDKPRVKIKLPRRSNFAIMAVLILFLAPLFIVQTSYYNLDSEQVSVVTIHSLTGTKTTSQLLPSIPNYDVSFVQRDTQAENVSKEDAAVIYQITPKDNSNQGFLATVEVSPKKTLSWKDSLITVPLRWNIIPDVKQISLETNQIKPYPKEAGQYFVFQYAKSGQYEAVFYWYETATCFKNATYGLKWMEASIIAFSSNVQDLYNMQSEMLYIARSMSDYWQPINESSPLAVIIGNYGLVLFAAFLALLSLTFVAYKREEVKIKRLGENAWLKLPEQKRELLKSVNENSNRQSESSISNRTTSNFEPNEILKLIRLGILQPVVRRENSRSVIKWRVRMPKQTKK